MNIFERIWWLLPDQCQIEGCCRAGIRGNENVIDIMGSDVTLCDYCDSDYERGVIMSIRTPWWDI